MAMTIGKEAASIHTGDKKFRESLRKDFKSGLNLWEEEDLFGMYNIAGSVKRIISGLTPYEGNRLYPLMSDLLDALSEVEDEGYDYVIIY